MNIKQLVILLLVSCGHETSATECKYRLIGQKQVSTESTRLSKGLCMPMVVHKFSPLNAICSNQSLSVSDASKCSRIIGAQVEFISKRIMVSDYENMVDNEPFCFIERKLRPKKIDRKLIDPSACHFRVYPFLKPNIIKPNY